MAAGTLGTGWLATAAAAAPAASQGTVSVLNVSRIDQQDVAPRGNCEPDTLVEPDIAVSPVNSQVAVAAAHDCRYSSGGAVDISYAWTTDGGKTWAHAPVPNLTRAVGGIWDRASDPVLAYGRSGIAYLSALVFNATGCGTGVAVLRSPDGGRTWQPPVLAQTSSVCSYSDDKNWLVVDNSAQSPHRGRLYQFWTAFITRNGVTTSPQVLRWSDNGGITWSATTMVNPVTANTQNSQPMIRADGTIVDTYLDYGSSGATHGPERPGAPAPAASPAAAPPVRLRAVTSYDGGRTWGPASTVAASVGGGPADVRCCLPAANIDPMTGTMYAVWEANGPGTTDPVELSQSTDGTNWSAPRPVSVGDRAGVQRVNASVAAFGGKVFVTYGTRTQSQNAGGFVQQQVRWSTDGGAHFGAPVSLGPVSVLRWAARAPVAFPGDYIGAAATSGRVYLAWCRSAQPPTTGLAFWQTLWEATLSS